MQVPVLPAAVARATARSRLTSFTYTKRSAKQGHFMRRWIRRPRRPICERYLCSEVIYCLSPSRHFRRLLLAIAVYTSTRRHSHVVDAGCDLVRRKICHQRRRLETLPDGQWTPDPFFLPRTWRANYLAFLSSPLHGSHH